MDSIKRDDDSQPASAACTYPRVYRPGRAEVFWFGAFCLLLLGLLAELVMKNPGLFNLQHVDRKLWTFVAGVSVALFSIYMFGVRTIGYKVTLLPDAIAVTNIHGTKTMRRCDITAYSFYAGGKGPDGVCLVSRKPATFANSLLRDTDQKLRIALTFERDDEFDSWITSLPCEVGGTPLPKRRVG